MKMKRIIDITVLVLAALMMTSCVKTKLEGVYNRQESQIDSYLARYEDGHRIVRHGGANRLVLVEGQGEELSSDGYVSFYYAGYMFTGNISASGMFITNHQETAEQTGWNLTDADYSLYEINLKDTELLPGLKAGLKGVKAGEECEILFSGKHGYGNKPFGIIPANTALLYKIWVVGVSND